MVRDILGEPFGSRHGKFFCILVRSLRSHAGCVESSRVLTFRQSCVVEIYGAGECRQSTGDSSSCRGRRRGRQGKAGEVSVRSATMRMDCR